jgi:hypothetical protein
MKRILLVTYALLLAATVSLVAVTYSSDEQITVANTAIGFTAAKITPSGQVQATYALCRLETAEIRYSITMTTPTSSVGTLLEPGDVLVVQGHDVMAVFKAIRTTATSGQLDCSYTAP